MRTPEISPSFSDSWRFLERIRWEPLGNVAAVAIEPFSPFIVVNLKAGSEGAGFLTLVRPINDPVPTLSQDEESRAIGFAGPAGIPAKSGSTPGYGIGTFQTPCLGRVSGSWETSGSVDEEDITPVVLYATSSSEYLTTSSSGTIYGRFWPMGEVRDAGGGLYDVKVLGNPVATVEVSVENTGSCGCAYRIGVIPAIESPPFYYDAPVEWNVPSGVLATLQSVAGFESIDSSDLVVTENGSGVWQSATFVRTCGSTSDSYIATATQQTSGWKWTFGIVGGAAANCADEVYIVLKSQDEGIYADRTNWLVIDTSLTPQSGTDGYTGFLTGCLFCFSPKLPTIVTTTCADDSLLIPQTMRTTLNLTGGGTQEFSVDTPATTAGPSGDPVTATCTYDDSGTSNEITCGEVTPNNYHYPKVEFASSTVIVTWEVYSATSGGFLLVAWSKTVNRSEWEDYLNSGGMVLSRNYGPTSTTCITQAETEIVVRFD